MIRRLSGCNSVASVASVLILLAGCTTAGPGTQVAALNAPPTLGQVAQDTGYGRYAPLPRSRYERALQEHVTPWTGSPMAEQQAVAVGLLADPGIRGRLQEVGLERGGTIASLTEDRDAAMPVEWRLIDLLARNRNRGFGREGYIARGTWAYGEVYADIAHEVLEKANEVRRAYFEAVAANETAAMHERLLDAAKATAELANEQYRAGTLPRLEQAERQLAYTATYKEAVAAQRAATTARESLNRTLRLPPEHASWALPDRLPELPVERPVIDDVAGFALANRPEALAAGVTDATSPLGAQIAAEVRDAYTTMLVAYDTARFQREQVIPAAQVMLEEMQLNYNAMLEDVYALIEAGRENVAAGQEYVENAAEFWIAHAELADLVGGRLPPAPTTGLADGAPAEATLATN